MNSSTSLGQKWTSLSVGVWNASSHTSPAGQLIGAQLPSPSRARMVRASTWAVVSPVPEGVTVNPESLNGVPSRSLRSQ